MSIRTNLEAEVYSFYDDMDPSGKNTLRLKNLFKSMTDKEFYKYMDQFFDDTRKNFQIGYEPFDNPVNVAFIERIAKKHNIKLYEDVYKPYLTHDTENPPISAHPTLVVDIPIKRLKQTVMSKSHTSISNMKRDARTGQVTGDDKTARITDVETYSLIVQELYSSAQEHFGPLADDDTAMYAMLRNIQRDGEVSLADLPNDSLNKTTLNTVNYMVLGSGISTNLVDESGMLLPITLKTKDDKSSTIDR